MGRIQLKGMEFFAHHGYYDAEQQMGNRYGADIWVQTPVESAAKDDLLERTVNYENLYAIVCNAMREPVRLLETIALHVVDEVLGKFPEVSEVEVTIRKFNPPVGGICHEASVTLNKHRES